MTALTVSQREAWERGRARALAALAGVAESAIVSVTRPGISSRIHIDWCLACQEPVDRCTCGQPVEVAA